MTVVLGPSSQSAPTRVAPRSVTPGHTVVPSPISTPASTRVESGPRKVTPARACSARIARWARRSTSMRSARSLTPTALRVSAGAVAAHALAVGPHEREHARQVALAPVGRHALERVPEVRAREGVGADVDLADGQVRLGDSRRVLGLHDPLDGPVLGANHAAVAPGVELLRGEHGGHGSVLVVLADQPLEQVGRHQRVVAREHHHRARIAGRLTTRQHGRAGALAVALVGGEHPLGQALGHPLVGAHHAHHALGSRLAGSVDHPLDHRLAADGVEDLGQLGAHARAASGGHDEHGEGLGHGTGRVPASGVR